MSPERDQDYLCEGLAEELIDALTHIEGLRVAARTSSFQFRGDHDLRVVGEKLGVGSLLEGQCSQVGRQAAHHRAAHRRGDRISQVVAEVRASASDVFAVQDEIAEPSRRCCAATR